MARGGRERAQPGRPLAGVPEGAARSPLELIRLGAGRPRELEAPQVVVREQLGVVLPASERLDPIGGEAVLAAALGARDLRVGDVANEGVAERVLAFVLDRRPAPAREELLAPERPRELLDR